MLLRDRHRAYLGEVNVPTDGRLGFWRPGEGAERVVMATLAIEDRRFDEHPGVDPRAVARALRQNLGNGERISGASTVAMQVARLQDPGPRTWTRKALEAVTALLLVDRFGREAVLEQYLTLAPYGNNVHGVRYAARRLFDKPLADLTWAEASLLAGLPQAPGSMNPYDPRGRRLAVRRAGRVLDQLALQGTITAEERAIAAEELDHLRPIPRPHRPDVALHLLEALDGLPADAPEQRTTVDLELQEALDAVLVDAVTRFRSRGAEQAAVVVVERETLAVRASVGSIGFEGTYGGAIDFTRTPRTPGSALKPFVYARALDLGVLTPDRILDDLQQGPDGIRNADQDFLGPLLPRQALANSRNVPAVGLAREIGLDALYATFRDLGLHDGTLRADHYGAGIALGGMPVTLLDLTRAYGALANDGRLRDLRWLEDAPLAAGEAVVSEEHAQLVRTWLADPAARSPTFPRGGPLERGTPVAFKTGTSPDHRDSWAMAITDGHVVGVWLGHPDWRPMRGLTGYRGAGSVLAEVLDLLEPHGSGTFAGPEGWEATSVCALTGQLATPQCDTPRTELFAPDAVPAHACTGHVVEGGRVVLDLPPRYGPWLVSRHLPTAHPVLPDDAPVSVELLAPADGIAVMADPDMPEGQSTLRLA
ncbi:MAG: transglycosylase domain-containing protein, partial [Myxococcales bacterium]|nr:transglycosylase domain-containing protein [Myxococcales bacterium]